MHEFLELLDAYDVPMRDVVGALMHPAVTRQRAFWSVQQASARAIALDVSGEVPCTCADIRHAAYRTGDVAPAQLLGWHYDACQRTIAALRETLQ